MNNFKTKLIVAFLAFTFGIFSVWAVYHFQRLPILFERLAAQTESVTPQEETFVEKQSTGNVEFRFSEFLNKSGYFDADFYLTNNTARPVSYVGCTIALKQNGKIKEINTCSCLNITWTNLRQGEKVSYRLGNWTLSKVWKEYEKKFTA